jgi:3-deoxy-D-manno-octulosonic acid (KDO) 8-phosphate synthase
MRSLAIMRKFVPVVFDATHSINCRRRQMMEITRSAEPESFRTGARGGGCRCGWNRGVHDNPKEAKSDGANAGINQAA